MRTPLGNFALWSTDATYMHVIRRAVDPWTGEIAAECFATKRRGEPLRLGEDKECLARPQYPCWAAKRVTRHLAIKAQTAPPT